MQANTYMMCICIMNNMNINVISSDAKAYLYLWVPYVMKFLISTPTREMNNMICGNNYMCLYTEIED